MSSSSSSSKTDSYTTRTAVKSRFYTAHKSQPFAAVFMVGGGGGGGIGRRFFYTTSVRLPPPLSPPSNRRRRKTTRTTNKASDGAVVCTNGCPLAGRFYRVPSGVRPTVVRHCDDLPAQAPTIFRITIFFGTIFDGGDARFTCDLSFRRGAGGGERCNRRRVDA